MLRAGNPQAQDPQLKKTMETLKQLQLGPMELRAAESYLRGGSGETALRGLGIREMTQASPGLQREVWSIFEDYRMQERYEEMSRYFKLLYALYGSLFAECMYNYPVFCSAVESGDLQVDSSIALTVYARCMIPKVYMESGRVVGRRYLQASDLESLAKLIRYDLQVVRRALETYGERLYDVKLVLYTLYFYLRSSRVVLKAGQSIWDSPHSLRRQRSIPKGVWVLNVKKRAADTIPLPSLIGPPNLDGMDKALLREYENVMVSALGQIFRPDGSRDMVFRDIQSRIRRGEFPRNQLPKLRGRAVDDAVFLLIACCAYANYRISGQLRGVAAVCAAADPEEVLWIIHHMKEFAGIDDGLDETFGIPVRYLIGWVMEWVEDDLAYRSVADMDVVNALFRSQFRKYPDAYLAIYKKADYFVAHVMARAIREEDRRVYEREVLAESTRQRDKVIALLTTEGNSLPASRSYLEGRLELSALWALRTQLGGGYRGERSSRKALEWYDEIYHDEGFYARCMAYMALRGCDEFFKYVEYMHLKQDHETSQGEMLRHTFQGLALAGAELEQQAHIACMLVAESRGDHCNEECIVQCCVSVFAQYLAERPRETRDALAGEGPYGRYLALLVYGREEMQEEIFACSLDSSKLVRRELEQILAERPQWRAQIWELLSSQKAAQREMGIRVLSKWNTPQDRKVLWLLREKEKNTSIRSLLEEVLGSEEDVEL